MLLSKKLDELPKARFLNKSLPSESFGLLTVRAVAVEERARQAEAEFKSTGSSLEEHMGFKAITRNPKSVLVPKKKNVNGVIRPMLLPGISHGDKVVPCLHLLLGTGNHLSQGFSKDLEELDNKDPVALVKARELRDVIAELKVGNATKFTSSIVALDDADVNVAVSEESEDEVNEGSEKEEQSAQETCRLQLAVEAATNAALELRGEADGHRAGDPTRVVQSRSKRLVTADKKAAEGLEESALVLELVCEEARPRPSSWTTLRRIQRTSCGKRNIGAVVGYLRRGPS